LKRKMKAVILLVTLAAFAVAELAVHAQMQHFLEWQVKYNKKYDNPAEQALRYKNFLSTIDRVQRRNANATRPVFGITKFADLTPEEFRATILMQNKITPGHRSDIAVNQPLLKSRAPAAFDWRNATKNMPITPVKDQEQCGSCWAFSVAETAESAYILAGKANASTLRVSEQQIVDCDTSDGGCNGGNPETAWAYVISAGGLDSESSYPYTGEDGTCSFNAKNIVASVASWKYACTSGDETGLQASLLTKPVSICVDAANWQDYTSGVMSAWDCAWVVQLDHCVQLVGYDTTASTPFYAVRNSWNTDWGMNGYILLEMGENTCGLTEEATIPAL